MESRLRRGGGGASPRCGSNGACCGLCPDSVPADFNLTCESTNLESVVATGPCAGPPDASVTGYTNTWMGSEHVYVSSDAPGTCHVELTFATGYTYSTDVTFATQSGGVCGGPQCTCGDYLAAGSFAVNNPPDTCIDAGVDSGGGSRRESGVAASLGAVADAGADAGVDE